MDIQPLDIVLHMLNLVVLFLVLRALLYKPVRKFMQERADALRKDMDEAAHARGEGEALRQAYADCLAGAKAEAAAFLAERKKQAEAEAQSIAQEAEAQAAMQLRLAQENIQHLHRDAALLRETQITEMAVALASELLQREMQPKDQQATIDAFISKLS